MAYAQKITINKPIGSISVEVLITLPEIKTHSRKPKNPS